MIKHSKMASMVLAGLLQVAPLATRITQSVPGVATSAISIVMTWVVRAAILGGAYHTVSAASATLASAKSVSGTQGTRISYQIRINDGENRTPQSWRILGTLFSASGSTTRGMPPGLSLSLGTGIISGTPSAGGSFPTTITAYEHVEGAGAALTFTVTFNITPTTIPTTITNPPTGAGLHVGEPMNLSVGASGTPPFTYRWQKDGVDMPNATSATYSIGVVDASAAGSYTVIVTGAGGSATSDPAAITVTPLRIQLQAHTPDSTSLLLTTVPGRRYIVQATESLSPALWTNAGEKTAGTTSTVFEDAVVSAPQRFWRYYPSP